MSATAFVAGTAMLICRAEMRSMLKVNRLDDIELLQAGLFAGGHHAMRSGVAYLTDFEAGHISAFSDLGSHHNGQYKEYS